MTIATATTPVTAGTEAGTSPITGLSKDLFDAWALAETIDTGLRTRAEDDELVRLLLDVRPAAGNAVLCLFFHVAVYQVGKSCFKDEAPADDHDKWFCATLASRDVSDDVQVPLAGSEDEAMGLAVQLMKLKDKFFARPVVG